MTKYDVTDEAIIDASPDAVYKAVIDELDGKTSWWKPHFSSKLREGDSSSKAGALYDMAVLGTPVKFTAKTIEVKENEMIRYEYVEGAFRGECVWKFEHSEDKTKVNTLWRTDPSGFLVRIMELVMSPEKAHSDVMQGGFENLRTFLS
jgi:ribosome-associated toxin RatA of RatAB toxin-antitoxin module